MHIEFTFYISIHFTDSVDLLQNPNMQNPVISRVKECIKFVSKWKQKHQSDRLNEPCPVDIPELNFHVVELGGMLNNLSEDEYDSIKHILMPLLDELLSAPLLGKQNHSGRAECDERWERIEKNRLASKAILESIKAEQREMQEIMYGVNERVRMLEGDEWLIESAVKRRRSQRLRRKRGM